MNDVLKWIAKFALQGILWVFLLSIRVDGHTTFFQAAHGTLVQNALVQTIDEELGSLWSKVSETAKVTFTKAREPDDKSL